MKARLRLLCLKLLKLQKTAKVYLTFLFSDWRILNYLKHSKDFENLEKLFSLVGHFKQGDHIFEKLNSLSFP